MRDRLPSTGANPLSWARVDLSAPEFAVPSEPPITCGLIYRGRRHALTGPPEAAKTLAALILGIEHMRGGYGSFALVDFEMGEHGTRLLLDELGATPEEIAKVYYVAPSGPPDQSDLDAIRSEGVGLVIIDAAAGAYDVSALDDNKRQDAERFGRVWIEPLWRLGIATILIDHVVKNAESRGRFAIGSERKLGAIDVSLGLEAVVQLHRGGEGVIRITTNKDRPGHLNRPGAAELKLSSNPDTHAITWEFVAPGTTVTPATSAWQPTILMDRAREHFAKDGAPISKTRLAEKLSGKRAFAFKAIDALLESGELEQLDNKLIAVPSSRELPGTSPTEGTSSPGSSLNRGNGNGEPLFSEATA